MKYYIYRRKSLPDDEIIYIKQHFGVVALKGDTALFLSTELYIKAVDTLLCNAFQHCRTICFFNLCGFLFGQITDKPRILPRCRSPPSPLF